MAGDVSPDLDKIQEKYHIFQFNMVPWRALACFNRSATTKTILFFSFMSQCAGGNFEPPDF